VIFLCRLVEFSIVNTHVPPSDNSLRDEFILLIPTERHSSFLWHYLDRANPLTMWQRINNPSKIEFEDLVDGP